MNDVYEPEYVKERRRRKEEREKEERQRRRKRRINKAKRWTSKLSTIAISILICIIAYNFLVGPVDANMSSTVVSGEGNFDKVVVNYEMLGDSTTKILLATVEAPDEEFIGRTGSWSFYNRSVDIFITVYIDEIAQPSEHFVLRTEGSKTVSCKNNISISFVFGVMNEVVVPLWEANAIACIGIPVITVIGIFLSLIYSWNVINWRWYESRY
jgi:hypothetical protein